MVKLSIAEIEAKLLGDHDLETEFMELIKKDERKGVQKILLKWEKKEEKKKLLHEQFINMTEFERKYRQDGFQLIAGVDEAGRGPLAGPVVAGAVILPEEFYLPGLNDSKKLPESKREEFFDIISKEALAVGVGIVSAAEIDELNILQATKKAMSKAIDQLGSAPDFLLIDAVKLDVPYPSDAIIKGDARSISIAAGSIIAKVTRDRMMKEIGMEWPQYGFAANMGYGTAEHIRAIKEYGITPHHRRTFAPVRECIDNYKG